MLRCLAAAFVALAIAAPAAADSWDSNKNLDRAMRAAVKTYRASGAVGLAVEARNCYAGLDTSTRNKNMGRDVEYCIAYEYSSAKIDDGMSKAMNFPPTQSLGLEGVVQRAMAILHKTKIVSDPDDFAPYLVPRMNHIDAELFRKL